MIRMPSNWNDVREFSDRPKLPVDGYICRIKKAVVQNNSYGDQLCILFDIVEGEYSNFYSNEFMGNTNADKKWKGVLRVWLPKDDGSEKDETTKRILKGVVTSLEKSNPGYRWNWDESTLSNRLIGILMRNEEWEYDGKHGWVVRPFRALSVDTVRNGEFTIPDDKPLKNKADNYGYGTASSYNSTFSDLGDDDGELPF